MALHYAFLVLFPFSLALFPQNTASSGDLAVMNQMALLEQVMSSFQAEMAMVTRRLNEADKELSSVKDELTGVKAELRLAENDIVVLKTKLKHGTDSTTVAGISSHLDALRLAENSTKDELEILRTKLSSAEDKVKLLESQISLCPNQTDFIKVQSEVADLKQWRMVSEEIVAVKHEMRLAEKDIKDLQSQQMTAQKTLNYNTGITGSGNLTQEVKDLQSMYSLLSSQVYNSKPQSSHADEIRSLRAAIMKSSEEVNQTVSSVQKNVEDITSLKSLMSNFSSFIPEVTKLMDRLPFLESNMSSLWSWFGFHNGSRELVESRSLFRSATTDIVNLKSEVTSTVKELSTLVQDVSHVNSQLRSIQDEVSTMQSNNNSSCCGEVTALTNVVNTMKTDVAFEVSQSTKSSGWKTLTFDTITLNTGGSYNRTSGVFTSPVSGTYLFWADIDISYGGIDYNEVYIVRGNISIAKGYTKISPSIDHNVISVIAVTYLKTGEQVHFELMAEYFAVEGRGKSSYGGTLIRVH